jgi:hypothetical protein
MTMPAKEQQGAGKRKKVVADKSGPRTPKTGFSQKGKAKPRKQKAGNQSTRQKDVFLVNRGLIARVSENPMDRPPTAKKTVELDVKYLGHCLPGNSRQRAEILRTLQELLWEEGE